MTNKEVKTASKKEGLIHIQNQFLKFEFNLNQGSFSIYDLGDNCEVISNAYCGVILSEKQTHSKPSFDYSFLDLEDKTGKGEQIRITAKNIYPELTLIVSLYEQQPFLTLQETVKNNSPSSIQIKHFLPLKIHKDKSRLSLGATCDKWSFYKQGWQSWSPTYSMKIKEKDIRAKLGIVRRVLESYPERRKGKQREFLSEGMTVIKNARSGKSILLGFTTFFNQLSIIKLKIHNFNENRISLECVADAEGYTLKPQEELSSEKLMLDFFPSPKALQNYAEVVSREMKAIKREKVPVGWCSWYYYFTKINIEEIEKNLKIIASKKEELPFQVFQVDDGYQRAIGDWLTTNNKFPEGLQPLAEKIKSAGFEAGLWLAPFILRPDSSLYKEHPNWILRDKKGRKVAAGINPNWGGTYYALDCTHPEVQDYLKKLFKAVVEFGFGFIKIDFVFAAALPGKHFNEQQGRISAYRQGLAAVREGAGDKTFILGCGAPWGPSIGLVDGMRIGVDVDLSWRHWSKALIGKKYVMGAANAMRNIITRYFMHQKFWINDPDCVLVREDRTRLSEEEIKSLITVVGLSGGMVLSSDNYAKISDERLKWLAKLIPPSGASAVPFDLMENEMPRILILNDKKSGKILIGFINWEDKPASFRFNLKELEIPVGDYHLFEFWEETYLGIISSEYTLLRVPAHGCRLISLQPVEKFPVTLASNFHITCGIADIVESNYDPQSKQLYFKININRYASGKIFISLPESFQEKKITSSAKSHKMHRSSSRNTILVIEATIEKEATFKIDFEKVF